MFVFEENIFLIAERYLQFDLFGHLFIFHFPIYIFPFCDKSDWISFVVVGI